MACVWAEDIVTATYIIKHKIDDCFRSSYSELLKSSGACYKGGIIISEGKNHVVSTGRGHVSRFGYGYFSHKIMEQWGFKWVRQGYGRPDRWCSPSEKKIEGAYLMLKKSIDPTNCPRLSVTVILPVVILIKLRRYI